ncbi:MAG: hypothetical protein WDA75_25025 [Candidatus Latescibacterota bacterium]
MGLMRGAAHRSLARAPRELGLAVALVLCLAGLSGCISTFSELQGGRLLGPRRYELTPAYSVVNRESGGSSDTRYGLLAGAGLADGLDLRGRYERVEGDNGFNVVGLGPKVALVPGHLALFTPVGFAFGGGLDAGDTVELHPTVLWTCPLAAGLELTGSGKALLRKGDDLLALNVGLGVGPHLSKLAVRSEVGVLVNPLEGGYHRHLSVGLAFGWPR